jgi:hypothetical protein
VTVTEVPSLIVSVEPVMAQPALGLQPTVTDTAAPEVRRGTVMVVAPTCNDGAAHPLVVAVRTGVARGRGRGAGAGGLNDRPGVGVDVRRGLGRAVSRGAAVAAAASGVTVGVAVGVSGAVGCVTGTDVDAAVGLAMGVVAVGVGSGSGGVVAAVGRGAGSVVVASGVAVAVDGVLAVADGTRSMLVRMPKSVHPVNVAAAARPSERGVRCMTGPWPSRASG